MKIGYISDLHLDYDEDPQKFIASIPLNVDMMIVAGDVCDGVRDLSLARSLFKHLYNVLTIYVPGNHEFYGGQHSDFTISSLKDLENEFSKLRVLVGETFQVQDGPRIIGTTLWYCASQSMKSKHEYWPDFAQINGIVSFASKSWENDQKLLNDIKHNDIVVSHMLPSWLSVDKRFLGSKTNELFVRDCENFIKTMHPSFWIHGHTHASVDVFVGTTNILCNPRGIPSGKSQENLLFDVTKSFMWK